MERIKCSLVKENYLCLIKIISFSNASSQWVDSISLVFYCTEKPVVDKHPQTLSSAPLILCCGLVFQKISVQVKGVVTNLLQELGVVDRPSKTMGLPKIFVKFHRSHSLVFFSSSVLLAAEFFYKAVLQTQFFWKASFEKSTSKLVLVLHEVLKSNVYYIYQLTKKKNTSLGFTQSLIVPTTALGLCMYVHVCYLIKQQISDADSQISEYATFTHNNGSRQRLSHQAHLDNH